MRNYAGGLTRAKTAITMRVIAAKAMAMMGAYLGVNWETVRDRRPTERARRAAQKSADLKFW